jgi:hypothetical protein
MIDENHHYINDLYEDMDRLNALYEELMWPHDVELEFKADYKNNCIIIKPHDIIRNTTSSSKENERTLS